jgi:signal transduction histidine kinase
MRERALLIGADLSIASVSGGGTEVALALPIVERQ